MSTIFLRNDSIQSATAFLQALRLFTLAESLGAVESLIEVPAVMTHASVPRDQRLAMGLADNLVRISVGIEDKQSLIEDLNRALSTASDV